MSALLDDAPVYVLPDGFPAAVRRRAALRLVPCEDVLEPTRPVLRPAPSAVPLRLTRRGVMVLAAAVAVLAVALVGFAWLSAPSGAGAARVPAVAGDTVAVAPGDSLWSIATRVAPNTDPRDEVAVLQRLNHLDDAAGAQLVPGQVLRVH